MTTRIDEIHDVVIVGAGPAGLAAARRLLDRGITDVVVLEREREAGGVPRHCHHSGYGFREFKRLMDGPGFARRCLEAAAGADIRTGATVTELKPAGRLEVVTPTGPRHIAGRRVLLAVGVRETPRPPRFISGTRPWGITTTGALQQMVYLSGYRPFETPIIIGSELVSFSALLTLRRGGMRAAAMIEENPRITARRPGDIIARHLFGVPVLTSTRLLAIDGGTRVEGVIIERRGKNERIACDGVVFTGLFRPESALLTGSGTAVDLGSGGPVVDQFGRCADSAYFACGNLIHPVETAGYCYREGLRCGDCIADDLGTDRACISTRVPVRTEGALRYVCPQAVSWPFDSDQTWHFNARAAREVHGQLSVIADGYEVWSRTVHALPERHLKLPVTALAGEDVQDLAVRLTPF